MTGCKKYIDFFFLLFLDQVNCYISSRVLFPIRNPFLSSQKYFFSLRYGHLSQIRRYTILISIFLYLSHYTSFISIAIILIYFTMYVPFPFYICCFPCMLGNLDKLEIKGFLTCTCSLFYTMYDLDKLQTRRKSYILWGLTENITLRYKVPLLIFLVFACNYDWNFCRKKQGFLG